MLEAASDPWLSVVLTRPVQRVSGTLAPGEEHGCARVLGTVARTAGFAYGRVPTENIPLGQLYEDTGFRLVDASVTLEAALPDGRQGTNLAVRMARADDATGVEQTAREAFRFSRFHLDPRIPGTLANEVKAQWAANYFRGKRGDHMVVAERDGRIAGFLQLLCGAGNVLTIDLIAVAEAHRSQGLASSMIRFAARECGRPARIRVGTQAANIASLRLYEKLGFIITATNYVFHHHSPSS